MVITSELKRRRARLPDHKVENRGLRALAGALAGPPQNVLQQLIETALDLRAADSTGISLLTHDGARFYWPAVAGKWVGYVGGGTPREHGPCGTVFDADAGLLFFRPQRHFTYLADISPAVEEALLVPFYVEGKAVGTVWAVSHDSTKRFDAEDLRVLTTLAAFAGAAYHILELKERVTAGGFVGELDRERAARLEAEAALRARDKAFLLVTHDLRAPLNAVRGWTTLLAAGDAPVHEAVEAITAIGHNTERLAALVETLFAAGRFQKGTFDPLPNRITPILEAAVESVAPAARAKAIALRTDIDVESWIVADFEAMHQAISNLLFNAVKFTPEGGRIDVRCVTAGAQVRIEIADSGIGIPQDFLPRLFQPFTQGDTGARGDGLGLGLSIVKGIVDAHQGSVGAYSEGVGQGTTFAISLPQAGV